LPIITNIRHKTTSEILKVLLNLFEGLFFTIELIFNNKF